MPPLDEEEEKILFADLKKKGKKSQRARLKIIEANLPLVVSLAKKYFYPGINIEFLDFIEEGNIGLVKAVERFDIDKGFKFSTYASWWIEKHFQSAVLKSKSIIQLPENKWREIKEVEEAAAKLLDEDLRVSDVNKYSVKVESSISRIRELIKNAVKARNIKSLDYYIDGDDTKTLKDVVPGEENTLEELIKDLTEREQLEDFLSELSEVEKKVLELRFGLNGKENCSYGEIAEKLNMSPASAQDIQGRAIRKLKKRYKNIQ